MKKIVFVLVLFISSMTGYGQGMGDMGDMSNDTTTNVPDRPHSPDVRDTSVVTYSTTTYHQKHIEKFELIDFDTMFMIQYAIVTEVTSMPENSIALSYFTNEMFMWMIISDRYYSNYAEAVAIGEKVRRNNPAFEFYVIKPSIVPKNSHMVTKRDTEQDGDFKIQYSFSEKYPEKVLDHFIVESYQDGFRQVTRRAFKTKEHATEWLNIQGHNLKDFWIYPLEKPEEEADKTAETSPEGSQPTGGTDNGGIVKE